jgi:hypothetical protein
MCFTPERINAIPPVLNSAGGVEATKEAVQVGEEDRSDLWRREDEEKH